MQEDSASLAMISSPVTFFFILHTYDIIEELSDRGSERIRMPAERGEKKERESKKESRGGEERRVRD